MLVLPLFFFLKFDKIGILILIGAFLFGIILNDVLQDYMFLFEENDTLERKITSYTESEKYGGQGGNVSFFITQILIPLLFLIYSLLYIRIVDCKSNLLKLEPFLMLGIAFIFIRTNFEIAYRFVDAFKIYFVLFYSELFVKLIVDKKSIDKAVAYIRSLIILFPIISLFLFYTYLFDKGKGYRYIPYNSVFERNINRQQQLKYNKVQSTKYPHININEY